MKLSAFLTIATFTACLAQVANAQTQGLGGRWEHRFPSDREGDILVLRIVNGNFQGEYLGLEREGEHGLFYSAAEITNLEVGDGDIRFVVPRRDFFIKRPRNAAQANAWAKKSSGGSNVELKFEGRFINGRLDLACSGDCPDSQMVFQRSEPKAKRSQCIGHASVDEVGSIQLNLLSTESTHGGAMLVLDKEHPLFKEMKKHLGELAVGQWKCVKSIPRAPSTPPPIRE